MGFEILGQYVVTVSNSQCSQTHWKVASVLSNEKDNHEKDQCKDISKNVISFKYILAPLCQWCGIASTRGSGLGCSASAFTHGLYSAFQCSVCGLDLCWGLLWPWKTALSEGFQSHGQKGSEQRQLMMRAFIAAAAAAAAATAVIVRSSTAQQFFGPLFSVVYFAKQWRSRKSFIISSHFSRQ